MINLTKCREILDKMRPDFTVDYKPSEFLNIVEERKLHKKLECRDCYTKDFKWLCQIVLGK